MKHFTYILFALLFLAQNAFCDAYESDEDIQEIQQAVEKAIQEGKRIYSLNLDQAYVPTYGTRVTGSFMEPRKSHYHKGVDIGLGRGEMPEICAPFDGTVSTLAESKRGYGKYIILEHGNGLATVFAHLSQFKVHKGQKVKAGQVIGYGGNTGRSSGPHLHFEVRFYDKYVNPASLFNFAENTITTPLYVLNYEELPAFPKVAPPYKKKSPNVTQNKTQITEEFSEMSTAGWIVTIIVGIILVVIAIAIFIAILPILLVSGLIALVAYLVYAFIL